MARIVKTVAPFVPPSTTITHNASPASTDGYLCVGAAVAPIVFLTFDIIGYGSAGPQFWSWTSGELVITQAVGNPLGTVILKNAVIAAQPAVKVLNTGKYNRFSSGRFVMNNAGAGNSYFQDSIGRYWIVEDIGVAATGLPQLKYSNGSGEFLADFNSGRAENVNFWNNTGDTDDTVISVKDSNGAGEAIYIATGAAAAQRLVQGSGGDFTVTHGSPLSNQYFSPSGKLYSQLYLNETTLQLEHNNGALPLDVNISFGLFNNVCSATYNASAASVGKAIRWSAADQRPECNFTNASNHTYTASSTLRTLQQT
jgi:hypothetical protein